MSTDSGSVLLVAVVAIIIIVVSTIAAIVIFNRKQKIKMLQLQEQGFFGPGARGTDTVAGVDYAYEYFQGAKNSPPFFKVIVPCSSPGTFKIARETKFDRFFKKWGICLELNTGDIEFDDFFYITTATPGFTRQYLEKREKRRAIIDIFENKFNQIILTRDTITAIWNRFPRHYNMENKLVAEIATRLGVLSRDLANFYDYEQATMENPNWKQKRFASFAVPIVLLVSGIVGLIAGLSLFTPLDTGRIIVDSFKLSLPLFLFYIWVAIRLLKGRSSSHRELVAVFFLSIFGFILAGIGGEITLNGWLDKNEPSVFHAKVIDKYYSKNKNSYSYYAVLESWREKEITETIRINDRFYENLSPGESRMTITTKPGKFGFPWLVSYGE